MAQKQSPEEQLRRLQTLRPAKNYHEDNGTVLWLHLPITEPPHVGTSPNPNDYPEGMPDGWLTHWSPIPVVWDGDGTPLYPEGL